MIRRVLFVFLIILGLGGGAPRPASAQVPADNPVCIMFVICFPAIVAWAGQSTFFASLTAAFNEFPSIATTKLTGDVAKLDQKAKNASARDKNKHALKVGKLQAKAATKQAQDIPRAHCQRVNSADVYNTAAEVAGAGVSRRRGLFNAVMHYTMCLFSNSGCSTDAGGGGGGAAEAMFIFPQGTIEETFNAIRAGFMPPYFDARSALPGGYLYDAEKDAIVRRGGLVGGSSDIIVFDRNLRALKYEENLGRDVIGNLQNAAGANAQEKRRAAEREVRSMAINLRTSVGLTAVPELTSGGEFRTFSGQSKVVAVMQRAARASYGVAPLAQSAAEKISLGFMLGNTETGTEADRTRLGERLGAFGRLMGSNCDSLYCLTQYFAMGRTMLQQYDIGEDAKVGYFSYLASLGPEGLYKEYMTHEVVSNYMLHEILKRKRMRTETRGIALVNDIERNASAVTSVSAVPPVLNTENLVDP